MPISFTLPDGAAPSAEQRANADIIERRFRAAGYDDRMIKAALANAFAESGITNSAVGDGGNSIGLFQLNINGAGHGMTVDERKIPEINTDVIISEVGRSKTLQSKYKAGADYPELTYWFCVEAERPQYKEQKGLDRQKYAEAMFRNSTTPAGWTGTGTETGTGSKAILAAIGLAAAFGIWSSRR